MLLYGGIELLFPDQDGELAKFLREHQHVDDTVEFAESLNDVSPRRGLQSWYGVRKGIGQTIANYPKPPQPQLNTLYWPTGATRWARGFFLAGGAAKDRILAQAHKDGSSIPLKLKMGDEAGYFLETDLYLLPPRIVARPIPEPGKPDESLWILPLVDVRYWWRDRSTDDLEVTTSTTWASLFSTLGTKLGVTVSVPTAVDADYLQPDPIEFTRRYSNVAAMLDAAALSVGKRIIRRIDGTVRAESAAESLEAFQENFGGNWRQVCGGGLDTAAGSMPAQVVTTFRRWRDYAIIQKGKAHAETNNAPDGSVVVSGTKKQIHSTAYADFTASDSSPSNSSELAALATIIATDFYSWLARSHDYTFVGVKPWQPTGFDDAIVWTFGHQGPNGTYQAQTRIQSMPPDFGFDLQLSQFSNRGLFEPVMLVKPDADIGVDGTGTVSVWTGRAGAKVDSTINVTAHAEMGATAGEFAVMRWIEDDWEIEQGDGAKIIRFELAENLYLNESDGTVHPNHARAYKLQFDAGANSWEQVFDDCVVYDWYRDSELADPILTGTSLNMWNGFKGYRGMAVQRPENYTADGTNAKSILTFSGGVGSACTVDLELNGSPVATVSFDGSAVNPLLEVQAFIDDLVGELLTTAGGVAGDIKVVILSNYPDRIQVELTFQNGLEFSPQAITLDSSTGFSSVSIESIQSGGGDPVDLPAYDIVWMERIAQWITFTTQEYMGDTAANQVRVSIGVGGSYGHYDNQGRHPSPITEELVVHDISSSERWKCIHDGAQGYAVYNNRDRKYVIVDSQEIAIFAFANASADFCGNSSTPTITSFLAYDTEGRFVGQPKTAPTTASNSVKTAALSGDYLALRRFSGTNSWEIIAAEKHAVNVAVSVTDETSKLTYQTRTVYVNICDVTETDNDIVTIDDCPEA